MAACLPFAWFWLLPDDMEDFSDSLVAVPLFVSNFLFLHQSGYFDTAAELKPFLHTWSLAVEEQFYIIFPLLVGVIWRFFKRYIRHILIAIGLLSLCAAQKMAYANPDAAFFLLPTRAWELLIGSMAALHLLNPTRKIPSFPIQQGLSATGLLLILVAIFGFDKTTPFPGLYALIPTIGALFIVLYASPKTLAGKGLGSMPAVGIGLISYSAYLWHQPLLAFANHRSLEEPGVPLLLGLCVLTFLLAYISWRYVEQPFRNRNFLSRKTIFTLSLIGSLVFILIGVAGQKTDGFRFRYRNEPTSAADIANVNPRAACDQNVDIKKGNIDFCTLGAAQKSGKPHFAVFGDSHSMAMLPLFDTIAKDKGVSFVHIGLGGCPPLLNVDVRKGNYPPGICRDLAQKQYDYIRTHQIKTLFLVGRWSLYTDGPYDKKMKKYFLVKTDNDPLTQESARENFLASLKDTLAAYTDLGVKVYVVLQVPQQKVDSKYFYARLQQRGILGNADTWRELKKHSISLHEHQALQDFNRTAFARHAADNIVLVDMDPYLCEADFCTVGNADHSYYTDKDHISTRGSLLFTDAIAPYIE